jgi:hypothetical protein
MPSRIARHCPLTLPWFKSAPFVPAMEFGGEGGIRTRSGYVETAIYRNQVTERAVNAVAAVARCTSWHRGDRGVAR